MIAYIKGILTKKNIDSVFIECMGLGYEVNTSTRVIEDIPKTGSEVMLYTYLKITEESHTLYGFLKKDDLDMFKKLIAISGVGPKAALSVMSTLDIFSLKAAVLSEDYKAISSAQGIGQKIAKRIILDLKEKVDINMNEALAISDTNAVGDDVRNQALEALSSLGYSYSEAIRAIKGIDIEESDSVETVLKAALKKLALF